MKIRNRLNLFIRAIFLGAFTFSSIALAQEQLPIVIPPSPTTVEFLRYGEHPVSHFTGVPDITIPIFTIQEGDITVPITMKYHASGFRAHEADGHTGMGWTLHTGGFFSKEIRGFPDELSIMDVPDAGPGIFLPGYPGKPDYERLKYLHTKGSFMGHNGPVPVDTEFDIYSVNFLGKSLKYLYDSNNSEYFIIEDNGLKFSADRTKILDERGISYSFGGGGGVESQWFEYRKLQDAEPTYYQTSTTTHLSSILSTRYPGRGVSYQYQPGKVFPNGGSTRNDPLQATWDYYWDCYGCDPRDLLYSGSDPYQITPNIHVLANHPRSNYTTKFPDRITYSSGMLRFYLSSDLLLDHIDILGREGQLLKRVTFEYGTFDIYEKTGSSTYARPRSKLEAIVFRDVNGDEVERYSFSYNGAGYTVKGTDYWGFANADPVGGLIPWSESVPSYTLNNSGHIQFNCHPPFPKPLGGYANKEASEYVGSLFSLQEITYPTGGYTRFTYEGHRHVWGAVTGGIRIKKIDNYSASNVWVGGKDYIYDGPYQEVYPTRDLYRRDHFLKWCGGLVDAMRLYINEDPKINTSPMGSSMVYGQVTEIEGDRRTQYNYAVGQAYRYKELRYPIGPTYYDRIFADCYRPWNYGYLTGKTIFRNGVRETAEYYDYETFETGETRDFLIDRDRSVVPGVITASETHLANIYGIDFFNYDNRIHLSGGKRLKSKGVIRDGVSSVTYYDYTNPDHIHQPTRSRIRTSEGDEIWTDMKYSFDEPAAPYPTLLAQNRMDVIEETSYRHPSNAFIGAHRKDWRDWGSGVIAPELTKYKSGLLSNPWEPAVRYHGYDVNGNPESVSLEHGARESYLWGYGRVHPVIKGINMTASELRTASALALADLGYTSGWDVNADAFLAAVRWLSQSTVRLRLQSFITALRNHLPAQGKVEVYTYSPGVGMSSATDARGVTVYYEYDSFQRLKEIRDFEYNILKGYQYHLR
ncbi:hypothetical protein FAZ19_01180 [Sphingobacterium alkalisoli]|uniref:RHS repeat protein n=1 Tax=Sphingobacterium alkalisoli TaxID=1874115 RepID=A0A4U0H7T9_9SPHI|nr:hypothetical protein [Sphingobacterium alkalisoli]TJY67907.1 hypothetical protein FAZ19_01180 [Sphingobacterium alkalisoli]GGH10523.1 hypothetical protein GCM10011418_08920 [Sphingobacterium alkalisoli]